MKSEELNKNRVAWVSILQALAIVAIVIGHLDIDGDLNPSHPIANWIENVMHFSLAVFFWASGFLYVRSSLFNKTYAQLLLGKLKRLLIPYIFITVVMFLLKLALPSMMSRNVEMGGAYIVKMFLYPWDGPSRHVWFLASLFTFFALMPLYKWTITKTSRNYAFMTLALLFLIQQLSYFFSDINFFVIGRSTQFFVFFYLGMLMMKWDVIKYFQNRTVLIVCSVLYIAGTFTEISMHVYFGIGMLLSLSYFLSEWKPKLFSSFSKYSYQIYLMHFPPIIVARMLYNKHLVPIETLWFAICWFLALVLAIYLPVIVSKVMENMPRSIRILIGL